MSTHHQTVEHVVLLNVKPEADSSKVAAMIDEINRLASLNLTAHLSAGKLIRSASDSRNVSHIIHCRFSSTDDLQAYYNHPQHLRVVAENIQPVVDDVVAVDWISNGINSINSINNSLMPGSVMRVVLLKLKEGLTEHEKGKVMELIKIRFERSEQVSIGENFSHEMAQGYSIAMIAVFPGPADLEAFDSDAELAKLAELRNSEVKDFIESKIVADYVIPSP